MKKGKIRNNKILTGKQKEILLDFKKSKLKDRFYLTGGTALSAFYLQHRISEDLDFFTESEFRVEEILSFLKKIVNIKDIVFEKKCDRRIFLLKYQDNEILKVEFVKYPFTRISSLKIFDGIKIDSIMDILANKIIAITDREEIKDYIDVYFIFKKYKKIRLFDVIYLTEKKFGVKGIKYTLQSKLVKNTELMDEVMLTKNLEKNEFKDFLKKKVREIIKSSINEE